MSGVKLDSEGFNKLLNIYKLIKKDAYKNYKIFSKYSPEKKKSKLDELMEKDYRDSFMNIIYRNTLLFPNDMFLMDNLSNYENLVANGLITNSMVNEKRLEYKLFKTKQLFEDGVFTFEEMSQGGNMQDFSITNEYHKKK